MIIKFLGHSCFFIQSDDGTSILTDPYKSGAYGGALTYEPIAESADIVTLSHEHEDHAELNSLPNQPLIIRADCRALGLVFDVVDTFHDNVGGKERGANRVILFSIDDIRIAHLGDLGHILTPEQVEKMGEVDVLLIPIGGRFTIDPDQASQVVKQIHPKIAIPMHFKTDKCGFPIERVDTFLQGKSNVKRSPTSEVVLRKEDLSQDPSILYIPPSN
ncbi:MAG: MBL fold metallo-hydrolase [Candidatus Omnitrophica bacterium]|nr:MBL fold metallo-hydrolase [Candidatus Omnitrophota bacterium]